MKTMLKCACMALSLMLLILPAAAEEATISVTGSATIYLEADLAELNIGVRIKSEDLSASQTECAEKIARIKAALESAQVETKDIATAEFSIYSYTDIGMSGTEKQYYQVNHMLNITVRDISSVGKLIDVAVQAGANAVNSIAFTSVKPVQLFKIIPETFVHTFIGTLKIGHSACKCPQPWQHLTCIMYICRKAPMRIIQLFYSSASLFPV